MSDSTKAARHKKAMEKQKVTVDAAIACQEDSNAALRRRRGDGCINRRLLFFHGLFVPCGFCTVRHEVS